MRSSISTLEEKYEKLGVRLSLSGDEIERIKESEVDSLEKIVDASNDLYLTLFKTEKRSEEIKNFASELLLQDEFNQDFHDPTMEETLINLKGITNEVLSLLSSSKIKKLEDLAEMSVPELRDIVENISDEEASALIMEARKPWFE